MPKRFNPIIIANIETQTLKKFGSWPYILPKKPLRAPSKTRDKMIPLQKLKTLNSFFLLSVPPMYANVMGSKDIVQGPRLVKSPAKKINNIVKGPG